MPARRSIEGNGAVLLLFLFCGTACNVGLLPSASTDDGLADDDAGITPTPSPERTRPIECSPDGTHNCVAAIWRECVDGRWEVLETCRAPTPVCNEALGCVECPPNELYCDGDAVVRCGPNGTGGTVEETCAGNEICQDGACLDACDLATATYSYLGCEFLAVSTVNSILPSIFDNDFAVVVGNPLSNGAPANVTVTRGGVQVGSVTVPAGESQAVNLTMVPELKYAAQSIIAPDAAFEVRSDLPVAAYQYNPLNFMIGGSPSFTNDASLLLPEHVLTGRYMASSWPTWGYGEWENVFGISGNWQWWYPPFITIAATTDNTQVTFTSAGVTAAGNPGSMGPGGVTQVTLHRGDVLQILGEIPPNSSDPNYCASRGFPNQTAGCPPSWLGSCEGYCWATSGDLTGSTVWATEPVAVFAGHTCTFMPFDNWACDHLEEMMFPVETWGNFAVLSAPVHPNGAGTAPTRYRILSNVNGNQLTFDPPVHPQAVIDQGQFVEFQTAQDFTVRGTGVFYATQTMLGQDALGSGAGDPAMGSGIPWNQVRADYDFLTPSTYTANYVNVVASAGANIELDGAQVSGFVPIGSTGYEVARVALGPGSHRIVSISGGPFGITTYGYASYTSYLYPGGMNFER